MSYEVWSACDPPESHIDPDDNGARLVDWVCHSCGCRGGAMTLKGDNSTSGQIAAMLHRAVSPECKDPRISANTKRGPA
jgi:hypothetical protein